MLLRAWFMHTFWVLLFSHSPQTPLMIHTETPRNLINSFLGELHRWRKCSASLTSWKPTWFCITLQSAHAGLNTHKLKAKDAYWGKCISTMKIEVVCFTENSKIWLYCGLGKKRGVENFKLSTSPVEKKLIILCSQDFVDFNKELTHLSSLIWTILQLLFTKYIFIFFIYSFLDVAFTIRNFSLRGS